MAWLLDCLKIQCGCNRVSSSQGIFFLFLKRCMQYEIGTGYGSFIRTFPHLSKITFIFDDLIISLSLCQIIFLCIDVYRLLLLFCVLKIFKLRWCSFRPSVMILNTGIKKSVLFCLDHSDDIIPTTQFTESFFNLKMCCKCWLCKK